MPDLSTVPADLITPPVTDGEPAAGKRVKQIHPDYAETEVHHLLYLPTDWVADRTYPVIVEYAGNGPYKNRFGDVSTGKVDGSNLGFGISGGKGVIWICMPYVSKDHKRNEIKWWGDLEATVSYCKDTVRRICKDYGGDSDNVFIAGFSRGSIACNYVGLYDDEIAKLWRGFICYSHYDGMHKWGYPKSDQDSALKRLQRLGDRPQFICQENRVSHIEAFLMKHYPQGNFTFKTIPFRNHNDTWILRDIPQRKALREWFKKTLHRK